MRVAEFADLAALWPAAQTARLFDDFESFEQVWREDPWTIRIGPRGEGAVLGRWREHLDYLAIQGLWCPGYRIPGLVRDLMGVAVDHGLGRLLSPLVRAEAAHPYLAAGLKIEQRIVVCRLRPARMREASGLADVVVRSGSPDDFESVMALDTACFDDFWRFDAPMLTRLIARERLVLAEADGRAIGYTLSTGHGRESTVGRLAVAPDQRRRGVGRVLMAEAVEHAASQGAVAVTLCTQEENAASRRFYRRVGFRELPGRLVAASSPPLREGR